jgi:hypothetical protein
MAATAEINTPERPGITTSYPVAADTKIFAGTIVALNTSGDALPAADTAGLRVVGRAEETIDNTDGSAGDLKINVKEGVFKFANSGTDAVDAGDRGKICFVEDDNTVNEAGADERVVAGRVVDVESDGVWIDVRAGQAAKVPSADTLDALTFTAGGATGPEVEALRDAVQALMLAHGIIK